MGEDAISAAIAGKRQLKFEYGDKEGERTFSPHVLFRNGRGELYVDGVQTGGVSSSEESLPSWRQFKLSGLRNLAALEDSFEIDERYNPSSERYSAGLIAGVF